MHNSEVEVAGPYKIEANNDFLNFQKMEATKEEEKPWGQVLPTEFRVTKADGTVVEGVDANTSLFTFEDVYGNKLTVSALAAEHIDRLHIKGEDAGSKFDESSLLGLFNDAAAKMPEDVSISKGESAFDVEMGKPMGKEGIASMEELKNDGILSEKDISLAQSVKEEVKHLNKGGSAEDKQAFIEKFKSEHPDCKVQFEIVRGSVLVPMVDAPKKDTTKLFMVFGPGAKGEKTLYTVAPGRNMPKHPDPNQHKNQEKVLDEKAFEESAEAWFNTVMLSGK